MTGESEIDVAALRSELDQIKDAMGIDERYPSQFRLWPVWGVLVLAASLASQYVALAALPGVLHAVVWFSFMGLGGVAQWRLVDPDPAGDTATKPDLWVQVGAVFSVYVVYVTTLGPALSGLDGQQAGAVLFGLIVALVGAAYVVAGNALKAYYIRRRDRWAFYVGGLWMLGLAVSIPNVPVLTRWGYAAYGVLFGVHSVVSYAVLSGPD